VTDEPGALLANKVRNASGSIASSLVHVAAFIVVMGAGRSFNVTSGSWTPFLWRATYVKVSLMVRLRWTRSDTVAEDILGAANTARLRCDLKLRFEYTLVVAIHRSQHHSMFAKGYRLPIRVSRDVPDREDRHPSPGITKDMTNAAKLSARAGNSQVLRYSSGPGTGFVLPAVRQLVAGKAH
jgi:hypothetical protein